MKITVSEALRLKNELAKKVSYLTSLFIQKKSRYSFSETAVDLSFGLTLEDGEVVSPSTSLSSIDLETRLSKLLSLSHKINSVLAEFNADSGVSDAARERQNSLTLIAMYELFAKSSTGTSSTKFEVVGNKRVIIKVEFSPHVSQDHIQLKLKELKDKIRVLQQVIDVANGQSIDIPFEYSDLEGV